jgi:hypothetical protein
VNITVSVAMSNARHQDIPCRATVSMWINQNTTTHLIFPTHESLQGFIQSLQETAGTFAAVDRMDAAE